LRICRLNEKLRKSGIDIIGNIPWGTHFCQFYQTKEDLIDILVPYFKSGLENNEVYIWVTSQLLEVKEAKEALRRTVPELDTYLKNGQIEFIPYTQWNLNDGNFDLESISNFWVEKLNQALTNGYEGLRLVRNTFWLEKKVWKNFADYEEEIDKIISNYKMMVLCTYFLDECNTNKIIECNTNKIIDLIINHQFALIKREGKWGNIENSKRKKTEDKIQTLASIVESSEDAIITKSLDGIITSWNKGAEQIYGYSAKEILGKPISILEPSRLFEETKELVELIKQKNKIHHHETLRLRKDGKIINISLTLSPILDASENLIAVLVIARDITNSKKAEEKLKKSEERYRIVTEQIGHIVYDYDSRTGKCVWGGTIKEVTGYSFEELQKFGKDFWVKNIHCEDENHVVERCLDVKTNEGRFEERIKVEKKRWNLYLYRKQRA
jgi:PAS domain S-box-containing protein